MATVKSVSLVIVMRGRQTIRVDQAVLVIVGGYRSEILLPLLQEELLEACANHFLGLRRHDGQLVI